MTEDFGPTGIDPEWYDNGPGSEAAIRRNNKERREYDAQQWDERRAEATRVEGLDAELARLKEENADYSNDLGMIGLLLRPAGGLKYKEIVGEIKKLQARVEELEAKNERCGDVIVVSPYDDGSGIDCPLTYDVESTSARPQGCRHPFNEKGDCGLVNGRDAIPEHCPVRSANTIIRLKRGGA